MQRKKYLKWTNELEYNGNVLPMLINRSHSSHNDTLKDNLTCIIIPIHIRYSPTYPQWRLLICITIDNGSNNDVITMLKVITLLIKL